MLRSYASLQTLREKRGKKTGTRRQRVSTRNTMRTVSTRNTMRTVKGNYERKTLMNKLNAK